MKRKIALLLCMILSLSLVGCQYGESKPTEEIQTDNKIEYDYSGTEVSVMAYNVYYLEADYRYEAIFSIIRDANPDILFLQEVSQSWLPLVKNFLEKDGYAYYGYGRYGSEMYGVQNGNDSYAPVLWKRDKYEVVEQGHFWLSSTPDISSAIWDDGTVSKFERCNNWVKLRDKETGKEFLVSSIHLAPEGGNVRPNGARLLNQKLPELSKGCPIIIGGDFNMPLTESTYKYVTEGGFEDVRFVAEETTMKGTFQNFGEYDEKELFGDYIFYNRQDNKVSVKSFEVLDDIMEDGTHASDHYPIKSVIYLNN